MLKRVFSGFFVVAVAAIDVFSRVRCCIFPIMVAGLSLGVGCVVGFCFCGIDFQHILFELNFVIFAIIAHIHLNEAYKLARRRNDGV